MRDLPTPPKETFRDWWQHREPRPAPARDEVVGGDVDGRGAAPRDPASPPPDAASPPPDAASPPSAASPPPDTATPPPEARP